MEYIYMFKQLWLYAERERWKVIVYLILHAISLLGEIGKPLALSMIINALQENSSTVLNDVLKWVMIYVLCFFTFEIFHRFARNIERFVAFRIRKRFMNTIYDHLQALSLKWHSDHHSGSVIDRVNKAADGLHNFSQSQDGYVGFFMKFWGPLIILWSISPMISVITVFFGLLSVLITKKLYSLSVPEYRAQNDKFHNIAAALHDYISNIRTIIMLRLGQSAKDDIVNRIDKVFPHLVKEHKITQIKCFVAAFIIMVLEIGTIFYYIYTQNQSGQVIMIGSVTAIFFYLQQCMSSFQFYTFDYESVILQKTDFEAVRPILEEKVNRPKSTENVLMNWNTLEVQSLNFSYDHHKEHLKNISLKLINGKKIAFVGESGAGKSTMLHALRALIPPQKGVLIKDNDDSLPISSLSGITALIPQEPEIFENTIRNNITMGMHTSEEEVQKAIQIASFHHVVDRLPDGLESDIREKGVNLSGGEKQRLALARGIYSIRDSSMILLDEPTSSVDPATEMSIFKKLFGHLSDKCVVCVLHRLHLVQHFDYVYVFKEGKVVEEGTFSDLRNLNGEFTRLWNRYLTDENVADKMTS
ncbi:ABC transporter ATP-binding protein [Chengkuizengella axinellae]|uniref:ABC transporter ATP-binding protein n=1 Tax=Chengkuizengella axinellae TaxID=3064388 RepID=A0ABT9J308_9BACL|nr:ABC transporter ATP-binding protein [Chengkuizengella sp. 2205SS18-9]MDP5276009.1 ABC transporter ATP-binding protein [Chengkuizengella sp. 2205SS18-9]